MDYQAILDQIEAEIQPLLGQGRVADYIPELACIDPQQFGLAMVTVDGRRFSVGDAQKPFSIQSISKLFTVTMALSEIGAQLWERVGREPSGTPFNSLSQLEYEDGKPRNPFINAGALVVTDVLLSELGSLREPLLQRLCSLSGNPHLKVDDEVAGSEREHGQRNAALAYFLASFGNLHNPPQAVIDAYFDHCAVAMSCTDIAEAIVFLANGGKTLSGEVIVTSSQTKYINSLMLTCGTYDVVGDFAYRVGLPAKSGVGGGIAAVLPGYFSLCVWSPALNASGNSLVGTQALDRFTTLTGQSIF